LKVSYLYSQASSEDLGRLVLDHPYTLFKEGLKIQELFEVAEAQSKDKNILNKGSKQN
jgi:hypothetical protein